MKILNTIFLLLFVCVEVCAQQVVDGHFVYEDDTKKVIVALSDPNQTNNSGIMYIKENSSITIPATVTKVSHNAFSVKPGIYFPAFLALRIALFEERLCLRSTNSSSPFSYGGP